MANKKMATHEPLFHIVKRDAISGYKAALIRIGAVIIGVLFCALLSTVMIGAKPMEFIESLVDATFKSERRLWKFFKDAAVLLCIALAITPAFRMRFWNIGAEGQVLIGGLAAAAMAVYFGGSLPNWALLIVMFIAAVVVGAIWGGIPAIFKAKWKTNETLFTLMMNYVATGIVGYFLIKWTPSGSSVLGELKVGHLPQVIHPYFIIVVAVVVLAILIFIYQSFTKHGYEISVVGESENTARYIGINIKKVIVRTMLLSGAICGIAGFLIVAGLDHTITGSTVGGRGFTAIMVSWLAKFNPIVMIVSAAFITFLKQGAGEISTMFNIDNAFPDMVIGIVLFFIIGCEFFINYKIKFRSSHKKEVL